MKKITNITKSDLHTEFQRTKSILTELEFSALNQEIPMTQELYDSIIDKIMLMIPSSDELLFYILQDSQYKDFMVTYAKKIEN